MHGVRLRLLQVETDPPAPPQEAPDEGDEVPRVQLQRGRHLADGETLGRETRRMAYGKTILVSSPLGLIGKNPHASEWLSI